MMIISASFEAVRTQQLSTELAGGPPLSRGRKPLLTPEHKQLLPTLLARGPRYYGYYDDVWTLERVKYLIQQPCGISCSLSVVRGTLKAIGYSLPPLDRRIHHKNQMQVIRRMTLRREFEAVFALR